MSHSGSSAHRFSDAVIGVDIGGTKIAAALCDSAGELGTVHTVVTPATGGREAMLEAVMSAIRSASEHSVWPPQAIGIGSAGVIDVSAGRVISATDAISEWADTALAEEIRQRTGCEHVVVHNDVNAHALGEVLYGAGQGYRDAFVVGVGTGVGAGIVHDGRVLTGAHSLAGEFGHVPSGDASGIPCPCGGVGHLEAIASGPGIARYYARRTHGDETSSDARRVFSRATEGDQIARDVIAQAAAALGRSLAGVIAVLDPEVVVIGGGLPEAGKLWWEPMEATVRAELLDVVAHIPILPARLGSYAALCGAAASARAEMAPEPRGAVLGASGEV